MKLSMRLKLMASYLLLLVMMGGTFYLYLNHALENYLVAGIRENLFNEAGLAALMASREIHDLRADAPQTAAVIGRTIKARVTIVAPDGTVVGDSEVKPPDLAGLENHLDRPEIAGAFKSGSGTAIRYSATLRTDMLYTALPFVSGQQKPGVVRLALPLSLLEKTKASLHAMLGIALAVAFLISLALSYFLSNVTSRTLRTIASSAAAFGRGDFSRRLPVVGRDELGDLGRVMNDMASRLDAQMEGLAEEKNRLDAILRGMGEGLLVADREGMITLVNPAFQDFFAVAKDPTGLPLIDISRHPALHETFRAVLATGSEQVTEFSMAGEPEKILLTHWVPLREDGAMAGVVAVFHDISELKRLERIRKDFVANVSHELRTPVTVIKGYTETLLAGAMAQDPDAALRFVTIIQNHADRLATLIGDLLTLSELESSDYALQLSPVSLEEVIRHCCSLLESRAVGKQIAMDCGVSNGLTVLADRGRLEQVLVNLLDNAVKYTPAGGRVSVNAVVTDGVVQIAVADTGQGIPPQSLPRIFERFYRVDGARSREEGGTGLGLAIVKHIVQLHGGTISVESIPGQKTTFWFTLKSA